MANEVRLIDANALVRFIDPGHLRNQFELCFSEYDVVSMIRNAPTIDPESPRPKGRWKGEGFGDYSCSLCCEIVSGNKNNYCPNCGANMTDNKGETDK